MPETKVIPTRTIVNVEDGHSLSIYTYYVSDADDIMFFISEVKQIYNGVDVKENELVKVQDGFEGTDFYIDNMGNLIANSPISENFEIDDNGDLILTT